MATRTFQQVVLEDGVYKFSNAGNWVEGFVPVTGDSVVISVLLTCTYAVDYPAVSSVISTDTVNFAAGTYHVPTVAEVLDTVSFGALSAETGTVHLPSVGEVISTATFGPSSGLTGTYHVAAVGEVLLGVGFGAASAETGTLSVDTGNYYQARATQAVAIQTRGVRKG
jgi:hypothetical protein